MNPLDRRQAISDALNAFASIPLRDASSKLRAELDRERQMLNHRTRSE
jgi:hypothetical protein